MDAKKRGNKTKLRGTKPARPVQELVAPHEWDALVQHTFENEHLSAPQRRGKAEESHDELWERLTSTRWLKRKALRASSRSSDEVFAPTSLD